MDQHMDHDGNETEVGRFTNIKSFIAAAREFNATHSDVSINVMSRFLNLIAQSNDALIFTPGRAEVCAFLSVLREVLVHPRAPHWAAVAVLAKAAVQPSARHSITHTYRFIPILTKLLTDSLSLDKKLRLLSLMKDISHGIRITWQESYLGPLLKLLSDWVMRPISDTQQRSVGQLSLVVLVNLCYGNLPAVYTLMRTIDTKDFIKRLVNMKEGEYGGVHVCRLLLCLQGGRTSPSAAHVHNYVSCAVQTLTGGVRDRDAMYLQHACTFLSDLCSDAYLRSHVLTYTQFDCLLNEAIKESLKLCSSVSSEKELENAAQCLSSVLKMINHIVKLELYTLKPIHPSIVELCHEACQLCGCFGPALELFASVLSQYKASTSWRDDDSIPLELLTIMQESLTIMLTPTTLDPTREGLQWLQLLSSICVCEELQQSLLQKVTPDVFEDTLYSLLQHTAQNGALGVQHSQEAVTSSCSACLSLATNQAWDDALSRMLANQKVRKVMCGCLSGNNISRRKQMLLIIKHPHFPLDKIHQVFACSDKPQLPVDLQSSGDMRPSFSVMGDTTRMCDGDTGSAWDPAVPVVSPIREEALDALIQGLTHAQKQNLMSDVTSSSIMELYGYKMMCLEQRIHSYNVGLEGATEQISSLQHTLALLQATSTNQQEILYQSQLQNEKYRETITQLNAQLQDAEQSLKGYRAKLASEKMDKENQLATATQRHTQIIANIESELRTREKLLADKEHHITELSSHCDTIQEKLEQQSLKNSELAGVLVKFEERVKHRDKRLEEAAQQHLALKKEHDTYTQTIKQLEKTVLERENRLSQVTQQLEEMRRVQDMVAKLMGTSGKLSHSGN